MIQSKCSICDLPVSRKKASKSGLYFCTVRHKNEALTRARRGDAKFVDLIPGHYGPPKESLLSKHNRLFDEWKNGGDYPSNATTRFCSWVREKLLEYNNYACSKCGWSEVSRNGTIPLEVDHIDGNWMNQKFDNIRILCPNCHALTDNWKIYNKGNNENSRYRLYKNKGWW